MNPSVTESAYSAAVTIPATDASAREREARIVGNMPLVGHLVNDYARRVPHVDRDDLTQAGMVALVKAADAYDETAGVPFGAYARRRILGAFADELRSLDWAGRETRARIRRTSAAEETLSRELGREPSVEEVAALMGVTTADVQAARDDARRRVVDLDETVLELAGDEPAPDERAFTRERSAYLALCVEALPDSLRLVVEALFLRDRTVTDLAQELGVTHSAVSQRRTEALRLLGEGMRLRYAETDAAPRAERPRSARRDAYLAALSALAARRRRPVPASGR